MRCMYALLKPEREAFFPFLFFFIWVGSSWITLPCGKNSKAGANAMLQPVIPAGVFYYYYYLGGNSVYDAQCLA